MRTLALNIAGAFVSLLVLVTTRAAEKALDAQDALVPDGQMTPAQKEVQTARDNLLDTIARLATAQEHLSAEHAEQQAALQMHSSQAANAFMRIQGIQGFSSAIQNTQAQVSSILNPPDQTPAPELIGQTVLPQAPVSAEGAIPQTAETDSHDSAAADMVHEGSPVQPSN